MYYAFLRPNELRGLKVNHIDMVKKVIDIPGKIAKNRRTEIIPINKTLFVVLMEYAKMILVSGNNIFLFGKKMKADKIQMAMNYAYNKHKAALLACGLQDYNYTLYSWKHTGASRAYEVTKDILRLSKLLRHASTKETENYLRSIGVRLKSDPLEYDW
jgi:integrase